MYIYIFFQFSFILIYGDRLSSGCPYPYSMRTIILTRNHRVDTQASTHCINNYGNLVKFNKRKIKLE